MGEIKKNIELGAKAKEATEKAELEAKAKEAVDTFADFKKVGAFSSLYLAKKLTKKGFKFKREAELKEAEEALKKVKGLKAKEDKTIICKGVKLTIIKGFPVSDYFSSLFTEAQKKQYFVK